MATLPSSAGNSPVGAYPAAATELDGLALPEPVVESDSSPKKAERFIGLYSWWQKIGPNPTPFVVVEKGYATEDKMTFPAIWVLLVGDSNRQVRPLTAFQKAVEEGLIENITHR